MDEFERDRDRSREVLRMHEELRKDLEAAVRREVQQVGYTEAHLERRVTALVQDAIRKEQASWPARVSRWGPLVLVLALVAGLEWWDARQERAAPAGPTASAPAAAPSGDAADPGAAAIPARDESPPAGTATAGMTPAARAAAFDSILQAGGDALAPRVAALEAVPSAGVADIAGRWRGDPSALSQAERDRLRSALLQDALNRERGLSLTVDGRVLRSPCGGSTCPRFLDVWREPGPWTLPSYPAGGNPSASELAVAEKAWLHQLLVDG